MWQSRNRASAGNRTGIHHFALGTHTRMPETFPRFVDSVYVKAAAGFTEIYERYSRDVYRFALYLSGDPNLAEDITAETFLRIWGSADPIRMSSAKAYLLAIARNLYLHDVRRSKRLTELDPAIPAASSFAANAET